jgi:hypothetical protein
VLPLGPKTLETVSLKLFQFPEALRIVLNFELCLHSAKGVMDDLRIRIPGRVLGNHPVVAET